jgi:hypothetical protein
MIHGSVLDILQDVTSPPKLAKRICAGELPAEVVRNLVLQEFDTSTTRPLLANSVYRASIVGDFSDKFLVRRMLQDLMRNLELDEDKLGVAAILNVLYICPTIALKFPKAINSAISQFKSQDHFWLYSNSDTYWVLRTLIASDLVRLEDNVSQLFFKQATTVYSPTEDEILQLSEFGKDDGKNTKHPTQGSPIDSQQLACKILVARNLNALSKANRNYERIGIMKARYSKPRIAVCIGGQIRGYEAAINSWVELFQDDASYKFFVSAWERRGGKGFSWAHVDRLAEPALRSHLEHLKEEMGEVKATALITCIFEKSARNPVDISDLTARLERYGETRIVLVDESLPSFESINNAEKMYYHNSCAFKMADEEGNFDLFVKIRPDMLIGYRRLKNMWQHMILQQALSPTVYCETGYRFEEWGFGCGDQIAISGHSAMTSYMGVYDNRQICERTLLNLYGDSSTFSGHVSVGNQCWNEAISVLPAPIELRGLCEQKRMGVDDFERLYGSLSVDERKIL